ncbi:MAG TPA: LamG-like jellyroll fold domain-containing protein [Puia sp.]|jgi:gliding motility-associated-like protein|nr:LamG-like jellyroll fold domain-containing protein [Puia sp.]
MKTKLSALFLYIILFYFFHPSDSVGQDITTGLLAYYPFNGNANDATGNGNNGTPVNGPTLTTDKMGNPQNAYYLDGVDDYIKIPGGASTNLNPTSALSVAMYFYPTRHQVTSMIGKVNYTDGSGIQFQAAMDFSLYPGVMFGVNSPATGCATIHLNDSYTNSGNPIALDQWHCFVATFDNGVHTLYVDGALVSQVNTPFTTLNQCLNADIQIGSWWSGNTQFFQGKIDEVRIYNRVLTPADVAVFCPSQSCPTLSGTLTGSNTCNNAPGLLTLHATSGTGPFNITYSDGAASYTQNNVQDGVPFQVQVQPAATTVYTLVSIQDISGCPPTTVAPGITATIHPGSCSLCTGTLGDPIINVDFGSGNGNSPPLETAVPGASSVNLTYVPVSGNPAQPTPLDGQYTITNNVPVNSAWFMGSPDHTGNANGYMLFENASETPGEFFKEKVSDLCGGGTYEFAAWIANADNLNQILAILPDLTFIVQLEDGTVLNTYNSGPVPQSTVWTWRQYGFFFTLPTGVNTVVIRIVNNNPGGTAQPGNDFAIDDITFRACGPQTTASFSPANAVSQSSICQGGDKTVYGTINIGYSSPQYLWQVSTDNGRTWTDLPGSNSLQLQVTPPVTGASTDYYYRMLAADGSNIQSSNCRVASNVIILSAKALPNGDFSFVQDNCNPLQVTFNAPSSTGATYIWNIEGTDHSPAPGSSGLTYFFPSLGDYPITTKVSDGVCSNSVTRTISVNLTPADVILTGDTSICKGSQVPLSAKSSLDFCWSPVDYLSDPTSANPLATPAVTTKYYFTTKRMGANLVVNGDFSAGNTGFTSDYTFTTNGFPAAMYGVGPNPAVWLPNAPACTDHTSGNGNMMMVNGADQADVKVWSQTITVTPNTSYAFSTWLENITSVNPATLQFSINGQQLGNQITANTVDCIWDQFYTVWNSGNATTAVISIVNMNTLFSGNDFALDDISFAPITLVRDSVTITVNDLPVVKAKPDTTVCPGQPVPLLATGADVYSWTPAASLSNPAIDAPVATPAGPTDYIVTGTTKGCSATDTVTVALFGRPDIAITQDTIICKGDAIRLRLTVDGGGTWSWQPASLLDDPASARPLATTTADTLFRVSITDANGCTQKDSVKVSLRPDPVFVKPDDLTVCEGFSGILGKNDPLNYIYSWTPATYLDDPSSPRPKVTPAATQQYTVTITDSLCAFYTNTFQVNTIVNPSPVVTATKAHDIDCAQPTTQLNASGAFTYTWEPAIGLSSAISASPVVSIDSTITYIVKGTSLNGCYAYSAVTVNVKVEGKNLFVVPNAFTPNGDGHNDCFGIQRWGDVQVEEFSIFNRWGQRIFTTRNPAQCWDGYFNGQPQPTGSYVYVIKARTFCGPVLRTGTVVLVR